MADIVIWAKPFEPQNHNPDTKGRKGLCDWHEMTLRRGPCPHRPYASVKIRHEEADREFTHSACIEALNEISQRYGFPIPQQ